jgi:hypothetical protein
MMEDGGAYINKENSTQGIAASLEETVKRRRQEDSQEPRDKFAEIDERYAQQKYEEQEVICACRKGRNDESNQQFGKGTNSIRR